MTSRDWRRKQMLLAGAAILVLLTLFIGRTMEAQDIATSSTVERWALIGMFVGLVLYYLVLWLPRFVRAREWRNVVLTVVCIGYAGFQAVRLWNE